LSSKLRITPSPALCTILLRREEEKGTPLTEAEVLEIRDGCVCIALPIEAAEHLDQARGYRDLHLEDTWNDWLAFRDWYYAEMNGQQSEPV
jgi:hypothetical protein